MTTRLVSQCRLDKMPTTPSWYQSYLRGIGYSSVVHHEAANIFWNHQDGGTRLAEHCNACAPNHATTSEFRLELKSPQGFGSLPTVSSARPRDRRMVTSRLTLWKAPLGSSTQVDSPSGRGACLRNVDTKRLLSLQLSAEVFDHFPPPCLPVRLLYILGTLWHSRFLRAFKAP